MSSASTPDPLSDAEVRRVAAEGTTEADFLPLAEAVFAVTDWTPMDLACVFRDLALYARESKSVSADESKVFGTTHLTGDSYSVAQVISVWVTIWALRLGRTATDGDRRAFWAPDEWDCDDHGAGAVLVIRHECGDMSVSEGALADTGAVAMLDGTLAVMGYRLENCTQIHSVVYRLEK